MIRVMWSGFFVLVMTGSAVLLSCGGGDGSGSPTPPETLQSVLVQVTTTGDDIDADGYTVRLGSRTATVQANGTATFDDVSSGSYEARLEGVAGNCTVQGGAARTVSVTSSSGAQVAFAVKCVFDFGDGLATVACEGFSTAATSAVPLDRVGAGAVPAGFDPPLAARVLTADKASRGYAWFEIDEEGQVEMVTPLHPSGALEGGEVLVRMTDGVLACEPFDFTIAPLPASPGELGAIVSLLQDVLRQQAAVLQTTPEELMATPLEEVEHVLLPMAIVQYVLDHPENDQSFRRIADGTAGEDVPLDLLEALLARIGLRQELENHLSAALGAPRRSSASVDLQACSPEGVGKDTQRLSDCMNALGEVGDKIEGFTEKVGGRARDLAWTLGRGPEPEDASSRRTVALIWLIMNEEFRTGALLPCCLTDMSIERTIEVFEEDHPGEGQWSADIGATNLGWDVGQSPVRELVASDAAAALAKVDVEGLDVQGAIGALLTGQAGELLLEDGVPREDDVVPPESFGPVPISDEQWSEVSYDGSSIVGTSHNGYKPVEVGITEVGISLLRYEADNPSEPQFGGQFAGSSFPVRVDSIVIRIVPGDTVLDPRNGKAVFAVPIEGAYFGSIEVSAEQGVTESGVLNPEIPLLGFSYEPPPSVSFDNPDQITVRHTATTGARANGPPRMATATVHFGTVRIAPATACVEPLGERVFTAEVEGPDDKGVAWSADVGTIDQDGHYTAPPVRPEDATATIKATSNAYPGLFDEIEVYIGECPCEYSITVEGQTVVGQPGDMVSFSDYGGPTDPGGLNHELYSLRVQALAAGQITYVFPLDEDATTWPQGPGTWDMNLQGDVGLISPFDLLYAVDQDAPAKVTIEQYEAETLVRGSVTAEVIILSTMLPYNRTTTLSWSFSAAVPPGYQRPDLLPQRGFVFRCTIPGG